MNRKGARKATAASTPRPYERLLQGTRLRRPEVVKRTLDENADADRGRVLFSSPFRRLQNKAQVFSLETNAAVRSRLTHSLEVSSIGQFVAQQALKHFSGRQKKELGIAGNERAFITFVSTACLLHDFGNPPFGHFGERAINDWFHQSICNLAPDGLGGPALRRWNVFQADFENFDGNPQGFRIITRLQAAETSDRFGLNLTITTLASTLKYPWSTSEIGDSSGGGCGRKKSGYFQTEQDVARQIWKELGLKNGCRHPLAYLMEAADDIAYCVSDIEDGIEKGIVTKAAFAQFIEGVAGGMNFGEAGEEIGNEAKRIASALQSLKDPHSGAAPGGERLRPMEEFRSAVIRFLAHQAGLVFVVKQAAVLSGEAGPILRDGDAGKLLSELKRFAEQHLYSAEIVRRREITAYAVLSGLLSAYQPIMQCDASRFGSIRAKEDKDSMGAPIALETSLLSRVSRKYLAVYDAAVRLSAKDAGRDEGMAEVMERVHRLRMIIDFISGMTDEYALESFRLVSGMEISPHRI